MSPFDDEVIVVIPARYGSSRFPGKPLAILNGKPVLQHVYEGVAAVPPITRVLVATDDLRILRVVKQFGGMAKLVDGSYRTGTDRVAAVADELNAEIIINLQADEIILHPALLNDLIAPFLTTPHAMIGTLKRRIDHSHDIQNPSVVKVVTNRHNEALYFSRATIPYFRDAEENTNELYMHLGIYIFRRESLLKFAQLPTGELEEAEKLEQLRAIENRIPIQVWETKHPSIRIDTPEDFQEASSQIQRSMTC